MCMCVCMCVRVHVCVCVCVKSIFLKTVCIWCCEHAIYVWKFVYAPYFFFFIHSFKPFYSQSTQREFTKWKRTTGVQDVFDEQVKLDTTNCLVGWTSISTPTQRFTLCLTNSGGRKLSLFLFHASTVRRGWRLMWE